LHGGWVGWRVRCPSLDTWTRGMRRRQVSRRLLPDTGWTLLSAPWSPRGPRLRASARGAETPASAAPHPLGGTRGAEEALGWLAHWSGWGGRPAPVMRRACPCVASGWRGTARSAPRGRRGGPQRGHCTATAPRPLPAGDAGRRSRRRSATSARVRAAASPSYCHSAGRCSGLVSSTLQSWPASTSIVGRVSRARPARCVTT